MLYEVYTALCLSLAPEQSTQTLELIGFAEIVNNNQKMILIGVHALPAFLDLSRACFFH